MAANSHTVPETSCDWCVNVAELKAESAFRPDPCKPGELVYDAAARGRIRVAQEI